MLIRESPRVKTLFSFARSFAFSSAPFSVTRTLVETPRLSCASFRTRLNTSFSVAFSSRSEEHTSELQSQFHLVCRLLLEKKINYLRKYVSSIHFMSYTDS